MSSAKSPGINKENLKARFGAKVDQAMADSLKTKSDFWMNHSQSFWLVAEELVACVKRDGKVLIFGNGGSACDALHFAGEWVNRFRLDRKPLAAMALTADTPLITCIGNDFGFDHVFEKQVQAFARKADVVIGISTSGNSRNVILGLKAAQDCGAKTIGLLGGSGGKIKENLGVDFILNVDGSNDTPRIQECHEWILHSLCEVVEAAVQ